VQNDYQREFRLQQRKPTIPKTRDKHPAWSALFKGVNAARTDDPEGAESRGCKNGGNKPKVSTTECAT
jgi:hypothetical protein